MNSNTSIDRYGEDFQEFIDFLCIFAQNSKISWRVFAVEVTPIIVQALVVPTVMVGEVSSH